MKAILEILSEYEEPRAKQIYLGGVADGLLLALELGKMPKEDASKYVETLIIEVNKVFEE